METNEATNMEVLSEDVLLACRRAAGEEEIPNDAPTQRVVAALKDYSARGNRRAHWYRMVLRNGTWGYFAQRRLSNGTVRSADRHDVVHGYVYAGELIAAHDRGGPVDVMRLVLPGDDDEGRANTVELDFRKLRDGKLRVTLPDGRTVDVPNPRPR